MARAASGDRSTLRPPLRPAVLALVAGWVDAIGYAQAHTFAGAMSGNTILVGVSLGQGQWRQAGWQALTVAAFLMGTLAARLLSRWRHSPAASILLAAALVAVAGISRHMPRDLLLLAVAMALLNAASTKYGDVSVNTSVITGNLVKLADAAAERLLPAGNPKQPADMLTAVPLVWLCYGGGAVLGTVVLVTGWRLPLLPAAGGLLLTLLLR